MSILFLFRHVCICVYYVFTYTLMYVYDWTLEINQGLNEGGGLAKPH